MMNIQSGKNRISFQSLGDELIGDLYCPEHFDSSKKYPVIVVSGPLGTVKEQAAGVFANQLSTKGFITLAFDFRTQGESEGSPRNYDNPYNKGEDIQNAVSFLSTLENIDREKIGALGICAGGSYTAHGIVSDRRVKAFATIGAFFSLREFAGYNPLITDKIRDSLLKQSNDDRQRYFETGESESVYILYPETKEGLPLPEADIKDVSNYYFERVGECWPNFSRKMAAMSYEAHIKSNALDYAKDLAIPYLGIVGSEAFTRPYTDRFFAEILHVSK